MELYKGLEHKSRSELMKQIRSDDGLRQIKGVCKERGISLSRAYRYIAPDKENTWELDDTVDNILAMDGLTIFSENGEPSSLITDFRSDYQKDLLYEKCSDLYHRGFDRFSSYMSDKQRSLLSASASGTLANPSTQIPSQDFIREPEIQIPALTTRIDYVGTTSVDIPSTRENTTGMVDNPEGEQTLLVTLAVGERKVKMLRVGIGAQWSNDFEDSPLSAATLARFSVETGVKHADEIVVEMIKQIIAVAGATTELDFGASISYAQALQIETLTNNGQRLDGIVGQKAAILLYKAARDTGYGGALRPENDITLSNTSSAFTALNFTTKAEAGAAAGKLYAYSRADTVGLVFRTREIVITDDYHAGTDMNRRYFRRYYGVYTQNNAPGGQVDVNA